MTGTNQPRGIYHATGFAGVDPSLTAAVGIQTSITYFDETNCAKDGSGAENYLIISPGLPGFPAGSVYTTNPISTSADEVLVTSAGAPGSPGVFVASVGDSAPGHAGITFDTVGTFGYALIVTTPTAIYGFNSSGAQTFKYPVTASGVLLESATVAPQSLSGGLVCPGCLYVTSTTSSGSGSVFTIHPGTPDGTALGTAIASTPGEPEGILFIPQTSCTLTGTNLSYFVSGYSKTEIDKSPSTSGALLGFTAGQLTSFAGMALVPIETGPGSTGGSIQVFNPVTATFSSTPFSTTSYQLEGASIVACAPATGCPATRRATLEASTHNGYDNHVRRRRLYPTRMPNWSPSWTPHPKAEMRR